MKDWMVQDGPVGFRDTQQEIKGSFASPQGTRRLCGLYADSYGAYFGAAWPS